MACTDGRGDRGSHAHRRPFVRGRYPRAQQEGCGERQAFTTVDVKLPTLVAISSAVHACTNANSREAERHVRLN